MTMMMRMIHALAGVRRWCQLIWEYRSLSHTYDSQVVWCVCAICDYFFYTISCYFCSRSLH